MSLECVTQALIYYILHLQIFGVKEQRAIKMLYCNYFKLVTALKALRVTRIARFISAVREVIENSRQKQLENAYIFLRYLVMSHIIKKRIKTS